MQELEEPIEQEWKACRAVTQFNGAKVLCSVVLATTETPLEDRVAQVVPNGWPVRFPTTVTELLEELHASLAAPLRP